MFRYPIIACILVYRWFLSPVKQVLFGPFGKCRFTPTCSEYALQAVRHHGAFKGSWLALKRLLRCQPWGGCGHDPVPGMAGEKTIEPPSRIGESRCSWQDRRPNHRSRVTLEEVTNNRCSKSHKSFSIPQ